MSIRIRVSISAPALFVRVKIWSHQTVITTTVSHAFHAEVLRRLMAQRNLTLRDVVRLSRLHERTVKGVLRGNCKPHPRTFHRLAAGLECDAAEFFPTTPTLVPDEADAEHRKVLEKAAKVLRGEYGQVLAGVVELLAKGRQCESSGNT